MRHNIGNAQYVRGVRVSVQRGRAMSAKFLSTRVMAMIVLVAFWPQVKHVTATSCLHFFVT